MPPSFLHGVEVIEIDAGPRPIQTVKSSVIGIVGTAPDADAAAFPLNTPVLVAGSRSEAAGLDTTGNGQGTLPVAMDGIFDQAGAVVVVSQADIRGIAKQVTLDSLLTISAVQQTVHSVALALPRTAHCCLLCRFRMLRCSPLKRSFMHRAAF